MRLMDIQWPLINGKPDLDYALLDFGTVYSNSRYVQASPFGNNTPVICWVEILVNGRWFATGNLSDMTSNSITRFVVSGYVESEGVVVQTGKTSLHGGTNVGDLYNPGTLVTSAPCRVHVWRLVA